MPEQTVRVEGVEEAQAAFEQVQKGFAKNADAAEAAGEALTPYIATLSRRDTGAMAAGWGVQQVDDGAAFLNTQEYWRFQEFGTSDIDPMHAITTAFERHSDVAVEAYNKNLQEIAKDAGF